ncbi:hypothetical protein ACP4OV_025549 [Aristida adscensionis]
MIRVEINDEVTSEDLTSGHSVHVVDKCEDGTQLSVERATFDFDSLPLDVILSILARLSLSDIARIASVSQNFLLGWRGHPILDFDMGESPNSGLIQSITHYLKKHSGGISSLQILGNLRDDERQLETWLALIIQKQIMCSTLKLASLQVLPNIVFSFAHIGYLELCNFTINTDTSVKFPRLKNLVLEDCKFPDKVKNSMQLFITGCPSCETMELINPMINGAHKTVDIDPESLLSVRLKIDYPATCTWRITSPLKTLKMDGEWDISTQQLQEAKCVTDLSIGTNSVPARIPFIFENLLSLELDLIWDDDTVINMLNMIHHAPNIQHLVIKSNDGSLFRERGDEDYWNELRSCIPMGLRTVVIKGYIGTWREYDLMKCLLHARNLQKMIISVELMYTSRVEHCLQELMEEHPGITFQGNVCTS